MRPFRKLTSPVNHSISPNLNKILNLFFATLPKGTSFWKAVFCFNFNDRRWAEDTKGHAGISTEEMHLQEVQNQYWINNITILHM